MTRTVHTISPSASFSEIVKVLSERKISGVPVVNKKGKVIGLISEKDLLFRLFPTQEEFYKDPEYYMNFDNVEKNSADIKNLTAKDIMSKDVVSVSSEDHILKACSYLLMKNIRRLPVIDKGKLVGIVTTGNIYKRYLSHFVNFTSK